MGDGLLSPGERSERVPFHPGLPEKREKEQFPEERQSRGSVLDRTLVVQPRPKRSSEEPRSQNISSRRTCHPGRCVSAFDSSSKFSLDGKPGNE